MKILKKITNCTFTLLITLPGLGCAKSFIKNQALIYKETDQFSHSIAINRYYSSRSLHQGYFGFGWCSDLDYKLNVFENGQIRLEHCGQALTKYKLLVSPQSLNFTLHNKTQVSFSHKLQLYSLHKPGHKLILFTSNSSGRLTAARLHSGPGVRFLFSPLSPFISKVIDSQGLSVSFKYKDRLLVEKTHPNDSKSFNYDNFDNLILIKGNLEHTEITYDNQKDLISLYKDHINDLDYRFNSDGFLTLVSSADSKWSPEFTKEGKIKESHLNSLLDLAVAPGQVLRPLLHTTL